MKKNVSNHDRLKIRKMILKEMSMMNSGTVGSSGDYFYALVYVPYEGMMLYKGNSVEELSEFCEEYVSHGELVSIFKANILQGDLNKAADNIY